MALLQVRLPQGLFPAARSARAGRALSLQRGSVCICFTMSRSRLKPQYFSRLRALPLFAASRERSQPAGATTRSAATPIYMIAARLSCARCGRPRRGSYDHRRPLHGFEGLAEAFDPRIDLVGGAEIENKHMVIAAVNRRLEPQRHFGAPPRRDTALEQRQLHPAALAMHEL